MFSVIQSTSISAADTTPAIDTTGANLILAGVVEWNSSDPVFSDSLTNTWAKLTTWRQPDQSATILYSVNPSVGAGHTFSISADNASCIFVLAVSGSDANPFDQQAGSNSNSGSGLNMPPLTPPEDNALFFTVAGASSGNNWSIDSGFTMIGDYTSIGGVLFAGSADYKIQTTAQEETPLWIWNTNALNASSIATFLSGEAPGPGPTFVGPRRIA